MRAAALEDLDWTADAHEALLKVAAEGKPFTAYSLVQAGLREPPVSSMWGKLFKDASEQGVIRYRRHIRSARPGRRGGACAVWKAAA